MEGVAVTRIEDQNFKILSCYEVGSFIGSQAILNEDNIKTFIEPLMREGCRKEFIDSIELQISRFVLDLVNTKKEQIKRMNFKGDNLKEYTLLCHNVIPRCFAFLLIPLSKEEFQEIERNSTGKTYLTGDRADMFISKKDLN